MKSHRVLIFLGSLSRSKIASGGGSHAADSRAWEPALLQKLGLLSLAIVIGLTLISTPSNPIPMAAASPADSRALTDILNAPCETTTLPDRPAQCGSQASSCKNCHEVKGEDPVNTNGEWHIAHAFGDFCENCHGGNVQAVEKDAAHQGLVTPLGDVKANCAACHDDYEALAQTYAAALGVTVGTGGGSAQPPSGSGGSSEPQPTPAPQPSTDTYASVPSGSEIVDYTAQYTTGNATPVNPGNLIVGGLLVLTVVGGGAFVYWNEKRLRRANLHARFAGSPIPATAAPAEMGDSRVEISSQLSPELAKLLSTLQSLDPHTIRALRIILSDRKRGEELLQSLSLINFAVLEEMKRLDKRELSLLLALAAES